MSTVNVHVELPNKEVLGQGCWCQMGWSDLFGTCGFPRNSLKNAHGVVKHKRNYSLSGLISYLQTTVYICQDIK